MIGFLLTVCGIFVLFGVLAAITAVWERLPPFPPMYDDEDYVPPPNVRSQRSGRESH